jgi:hypothetical protein
MAAVVQTFVWENSVTLVARTYETLNRIDGIAYSSEAVESSALRYASLTHTPQFAKVLYSSAGIRIEDVPEADTRTITQLSAVRDNVRGLPFVAEGISWRIGR